MYACHDMNGANVILILSFENFVIQKIIQSFPRQAKSFLGFHRDSGGIILQQHVHQACRANQFLGFLPVHVLEFLLISCFKRVNTEVAPLGHEQDWHTEEFEVQECWTTGDGER